MLYLVTEYASGGEIFGTYLNIRILTLVCITPSCAVTCTVCPPNPLYELLTWYSKICIMAPGKVCNFIYTCTIIMPISSPNPMFDHLLESSHRDDSCLTTC